MQLIKREKETTSEYLKRLEDEFKKSPDIQFWMKILYNSKLKDRIEYVLELIDSCNTDDITSGKIKGKKLNSIDLQIIEFMFYANQIVISNKLNGSQFITEFIYNKLKK